VLQHSEQTLFLPTVTALNFNLPANLPTWCRSLGRLALWATALLSAAEACKLNKGALSQGFALLFNGFIIQQGDIRGWWIWVRSCCHHLDTAASV